MAHLTTVKPQIISETKKQFSQTDPKYQLFQPVDSEIYFLQKKSEEVYCDKIDRMGDVYFC